MGVRRLRSVVAGHAFAGGLACIACSALALQAGAQTVTDFVAENRAVAFAIGGSIPGGAFRGHGVYEIDAPTKRFSVRFTMPATRTVTAVQLYGMKNGAPGTLRLRVYPDDPLTAQPDLSALLGSTNFSVQTGWQRIPLPSQPTLVQSNAYHLVVEPAPGASPFNDLNKASYFTAVSRFPVPFQPNPAPPQGFDSFYDPALTLMYSDGTPPGLVAQWHPEGTLDGIDPIYVLECSDGSVLGWPYEDHQEPLVNASNWYGQALHLAPGETLSFNYVAVFTRGRKGTQTDKLMLDVIDANSGQTLTSVVVLDPVFGTASLTINRSHWFGVSLPPQVLQGGASGRTFYLMLRGEPPTATGARPYGYVFSLETSSLDYPASVLPTYRFDQSYAVQSHDGGVHIEPLYKADSGFMLASLAGPTPIASYDEGMVSYDPTGPDPLVPDVRVAPAGATLVFAGTVRNIGTATGDIWFDLVNADTGVSALSFPGPAIYPNVPPNSDTNDSQPASITFQMTNAPVLRLNVQLGHFAPDGTTRVLDDQNRIEIRRNP